MGNQWSRSLDPETVFVGLFASILLVGDMGKEDEVQVRPRKLRGLQ